ncbi:ABC transporter ATP-binding protein [Glaciibacter psychrotolerans]|uniref:ABC-type dipeptide/oligopeptide/nickel transport system ATPase component n=1 Tax=Glaciibacter psychrotolerans TaxID=670054 RepID=A0A7Z0EGI0_9MICO|nr:ABC transporter ATP-binding protein [Leifsonia psychrotolerans]NYJ21073.1 ABC-type dipeptide/oligopeptide/nickel transport system ATPase component [Leifsonia psychrotolerans]
MSLVTVSNLTLRTDAGDVIVSGIDLTIGHGEIVGVIGESGSGKSMTLKAIAGLLPTGINANGSIDYEGTELTRLSRRAYRSFRDRELGIVYQDPRAHVNPVHTVGDFLTEALRTNRRMSKKDALARIYALCDEVGITDPEHQLRAYPYQFSGGMLQRAVIAAALATDPRLILADEPTTALDVTRQAEVAALLRRQVRERGIGMMFITHDLELAAALCDRVYVMYRGVIVDEFPADRIYESRHPYTQALLSARPSLERGQERLATISDELRAEIDEEVAGR